MGIRLVPSKRGAFCNAIAATALENEMTAISTFLQGYESRVRAYRTLPNVPYEGIQSKAGQHELMHPDDFYLSPEGFVINIDENWENAPANRIPAVFDFPSQVKFLGGVRFRKGEGLEPIKHAGQFTVKKMAEIENPKIEIWVGSHSSPIALIQQMDKDNKFKCDNSKTGVKVLFSLEDVLNEVVQLSKIHKGTEPYWDHREAYVREVLPNFFK